MRSLSCLLLLVLAAAVIIAGCTQAPGPVAPAAPEPAVPGTVTAPDLPSLALAPADLPACFSRTGEQGKTADDVGDLARQAGWEGGYEAVFSCPSAGAGPTVIVHSLALYPAGNVPGIAAMVDRQDRPAGFLYANISDPDPGFFVSGFSARVNSTGPSAASRGAFVLAGGRNVSAPASASQGDFAEFIVFRGNVLEILKMTGPDTNATLLHGLARAAAQKIP